MTVTLPDPLSPGDHAAREAARHTVAVYAFDGMSPFELSCVVEIFGLPRPEFDFPWYRLKVCSEGAAALRVVGGFALATEHGMDEFEAADTLVVTAVPTMTSPLPPALTGALRRAYERGARILSICSGAFALAEAGLLDGRGATTHWLHAGLLAERFPKVRVEPDVLYVDEGRIVTSAGSAAGLDACLHIVRLDHGAAVANAVARRLVLPPHREGGQAQFIEAAVRPAGADDGIARSQRWAMDHLAEPIAVADLARAANMSQRSYIRHFQKAVGTSPLRWVLSQRVAAARPLLETGDTPVEGVGTAVGFADPATFRHHFRRLVGTSPAAYRRAFRG
jgi:AraC family transcriptional regulator, transcriptional activator FtrA